METGSFNCLCLTKLGFSIVFNPTLLIVRKYGVIVSSDDCQLPFLSHLLVLTEATPKQARTLEEQREVTDCGCYIK